MTLSAFRNPALLEPLALHPLGQQALMVMTLSRTRTTVDRAWVGVARREAAAALEQASYIRPDHEDLHVAVETVVSELATNALIHGSGNITVTLFSSAVKLLVAVDTVAGSGAPCARDAAPDEESGRGLAIVECLATRWGVKPLGRKVRVWAEFAVTSPTTDAPAAGRVAVVDQRSPAPTGAYVEPRRRAATDGRGALLAAALSKECCLDEDSHANYCVFDSSTGRP